MSMSEIYNGVVVVNEKVFQSYRTRIPEEDMSDHEIVVCIISACLDSSSAPDDVAIFDETVLEKMAEMISNKVSYR